MNTEPDIRLEIRNWGKELLPLSKTELVREMSLRLEPIVAQLLDKISVLAQQIQDLEKTVEQCKTRTVSSI